MLIPSAMTNLVSCKPDYQWAGPRSWWAGGCAGTGIPNLGRKTSHTSGATRCRSPGGNAPVDPCSSTRTWSRKRWRTRPMSEPVELRPREHLWPTCRHHNMWGLYILWQHSHVYHQLLTLKGSNGAGFSQGLFIENKCDFRCAEFQNNFGWMKLIMLMCSKGSS